MVLRPLSGKDKAIRLAAGVTPHYVSLTKQNRSAAAMAEGVNRFLGDSPLRVIVKLVVVSILVGFVMTVFGWYPQDILFGIRNFVVDLWNSGFAALGRVGDYLLLGAVIVVPAFILLRIFARK